MPTLGVIVVIVDGQKRQVLTRREYFDRGAWPFPP
jgi:hypothetical protein